MNRDPGSNNIDIRNNKIGTHTVTDNTSLTSINKETTAHNVGSTPGSEMQPINSYTISGDNNLRILYITLAVIIGLFLLWIVIVVFTKEDPVKILGAMNNLATQTPAVSDLPSNPTPINDDTIIVPEGYVADVVLDHIDSSPPI